MRRHPRLRRVGSVAALLTGVVCSGCLSHTTVVRVDHGREHEGRFVTPESYAITMEAALAEAAGKRDEARTLYEQAVSIDPKNVAAWSRIGSLSCATDRKKADSAIARAIDLEPDGFDGWLARAQCELWHKEYARAMASAERAVAALPESRDANFIYAVALSRNGEPEEARRWLVALELFAPSTRSGRFDPAGALDAAIEKGNAASVKQVALATRVPDTEVARAALGKGQLALAREIADRAQMADPDDGDAWVVASAIADLQGDGGRFAELLRRAPRSATPVSPGMRGLLLELIGRRTRPSEPEEAGPRRDQPGKM